jgi:hypothetical protein
LRGGSFARVLRAEALRTRQLPRSASPVPAACGPRRNSRHHARKSRPAVLPRRASCRRAKITVKGARFAHVAGAMAQAPPWTLIFPGKDPPPIRRTGGKRGPELRPSMPLLGRVRKLVVHVLGPTVGLAGQKTFLDADNPKEAVDPESEQDWHHNVDPPHVDHHFSRNILHLPYGQRLNPLGQELPSTAA